MNILKVILFKYFYQLLFYYFILQGCGNQIFDYSKTILIKDNGTTTSTDNNSTKDSQASSSLYKPNLDVMSEPLVRPGTRTVDRCGENTKRLPEVEVASPTR